MCQSVVYLFDLEWDGDAFSQVEIILSVMYFMMNTNAGVTYSSTIDRPAIASADLTMWNCGSGFGS